MPYQCVLEGGAKRVSIVSLAKFSDFDKRWGENMVAHRRLDLNQNQGGIYI